MSEHLHLAFVCGITTFPHDTRSHPLCCASRNEAIYPQYVPTKVPGPITEWQEAPLHEPVRVPLPNKAALLMGYQERHRDGTPQESTLVQWLDDRRMLLDLTVYDRLRKAVPAEFSETTGPQAMDVVYWQGWGVPDNPAADAGVIGYTVDSLPYNDTMAYVFGSIYPPIS